MTIRVYLVPRLVAALAAAADPLLATKGASEDVIR